MDKNLFNELCKEESELVEKLRVLREFKNAFFKSDEVVMQLKSSVDVSKPYQSNITISAVTKKVKPYKKRTVLTIPTMVLNSLDEIDRGTTQDIANKLVKLYPSVPLEKALKDTKHHVSLLSKVGKIKIVEKRPGKLGFTYQSINSLL